MVVVEMWWECGCGAGVARMWLCATNSATHVGLAEIIIRLTT